MAKKTDNLGENYLDKIIYYIKKNRLQTFYNLTLIVIILIQTPFMISGLNSVSVQVDLPPLGVIYLKNNSANKLYYRLWTEHFTNNHHYYKVIKNGKNETKVPYSYSIVSFNYLDVGEKIGKFLKYYNPIDLIKDKHTYQDFVKNVKVKMLSQKYFVSHIKIKLLNDGHKAIATVYGVATQSFATTAEKPKKCEYTFIYSRMGGKLYVDSLQTNCF